MPKIVELRQDRNLVRSNFDGYKLSLDAIPVLRQDQDFVPPKNTKPSEHQYSLLHAELFSLQNLLQADPWNRYIAYYINDRNEVTRCSYDENSGRPESLQIVYKINTKEYAKGDYNLSIVFISEKFCVICDGIDGLLLLDTGDRRKITQWKEVASAVISTVERNFMLYDSRLDIIQEKKQISLAIGRIEQEENETSGSSYFLRLYWAKWIQKDNATWEFEIVETLESKGSLYYCAFEPRAESLIISSNRDFHFKSQNSNESMETEETINEKPQLHDQSEHMFNFNWTQTNEDVVVELATKPNSEKKDFKVNSTAESLTIKWREETLLEQSLFEKIDADLTTWTIERDVMEVSLTKQTPLVWPSLLPNGIEGPKERTCGNRNLNIPPEQQPIANLEAPIEDCDFPISTTDNDVKIERFNLPTKTVTHGVLLGSTPPLFSTNLRAGFPKAIATRQDVDACLWLLQYNPISKPDEWSLRHEGNLHAFGYVQASKQQRKFMDCGPDLSYAIICESFRHVFLYKMNNETANGLRNRNGPQVTLGKQHLITLENIGEVLGIATAPNVVILLTEKCLLYLQIN